MRSKGDWCIESTCSVPVFQSPLAEDISHNSSMIEGCKKCKLQLGLQVQISIVLLKDAVSTMTTNEHRKSEPDKWMKIHLSQPNLTIRLFGSE